MSLVIVTEPIKTSKVLVFKYKKWWENPYYIYLQGFGFEFFLSDSVKKNLYNTVAMQLYKLRMSGNMMGNHMPIVKKTL